VCEFLDDMQKCREVSDERAEKPWPIGSGGSFADIALRIAGDAESMKDMTWDLLKKTGLAATYEEFLKLACKVRLHFDYYGLQVSV
jgi:hypothetical protein